MARSRRARRPMEAVEINITAFMNLMVVLVPFLLVTAVFTHLSIIELNLPPADSASAAKKDPNPPFELHIIVRNSGFTLRDNRNRTIADIATTRQGPNYKALYNAIRQIKGNYPDRTVSMILADPKTPYAVIVKVMDGLRGYNTMVNGQLAMVELFPDISIGDAPNK